MKKKGFDTQRYETNVVHVFNNEKPYASISLYLEIYKNLLKVSVFVSFFL